MGLVTRRRQLLQGRVFDFQLSTFERPSIFPISVSRSRSHGTTLDEYAIVVADKDGVIRMWSRGAQELFGYDAAGAVGQSLDLIVPEAFRERHWAGLRQVMAGGDPKFEGAAANLSVKCSDGSIKRFPARLSLLRNSRGEVIGSLATYGPATQQLKAES